MLMIFEMDMNVLLRVLFNNSLPMDDPVLVHMGARILDHVRAAIYLILKVQK